MENIIPEIDSLFIAFNCPLEEFFPSDPELVSEVLQIGVRNQTVPVEIYIFNVRIKSIQSIVLTLEGHRFINHSIVFKRFDAAKIRRLIQESINGFPGGNWSDFIQYFSYFCIWENQEYPSLLRGQISVL